MSKKIRLWVAVIALTLLIVPSLMTAGAQEEEMKQVKEIGQWVSARVIGMKFEPAGNETYTTTEEVFCFTIRDSRNTLTSIVSDTLYMKAVFAISQENNTAKTTELAPDENGIYALKMPEPGNYSIGIAAGPVVAVPIIGNLITPTYSSQITVVREAQGIPLMTILIVIGLLIAAVAVVAMLLRYIKSRVAEEEEEKEEEEEEDKEKEEEEDFP